MATFRKVSEGASSGQHFPVRSAPRTDDIHHHLHDIPLDTMQPTRQRGELYGVENGRVGAVVDGYAPVQNVALCEVEGGVERCDYISLLVLLR